MLKFKKIEKFNAPVYRASIEYQGDIHPSIMLPVYPGNNLNPSVIQDEDGYSIEGIKKRMVNSEELHDRDLSFEDNHYDSFDLRPFKDDPVKLLAAVSSYMDDVTYQYSLDDTVGKVNIFHSFSIDVSGDRALLEMYTKSSGITTINYVCQPRILSLDIVNETIEKLIYRRIESMEFLKSKITQTIHEVIVGIHNEHVFLFIEEESPIFVGYAPIYDEYVLIKGKKRHVQGSSDIYIELSDSQWSTVLTQNYNIFRSVIRSDKTGEPILISRSFHESVIRSDKTGKPILIVRSFR